MSSSEKTPIRDAPADESTSGTGDAREDFRMTVMRRALDLFASHGYEATTVDQIADVSGISRRTFFRQFRAKEDVVFVDHDHALDQVTDYLSLDHPDPIAAVCQATEIVYRRFLELGPLAEQRYRVVRQVPTLRDREILMTTRYERLFHSYLQRSLPAARRLDAVQIAAAITATHNWFLRRMVRGESAGLAALRTSLTELCGRFVAPTPRSDADPAEPMVVAVFPFGAEPTQIAEAIDRALRRAEDGYPGDASGRS